MGVNPNPPSLAYALTGCDNHNTLTFSAKGKQKILSRAGEDHAVNINLCVKLVVPLILADTQRAKISFNKRDDVSFMYWWFIYVIMKQSIVLQKRHLLVFVVFTVRFVPITAVR